MYILYIVLAILILLLMVTIHEFGHYIAGRLLGFKIVEFSIGFGPAIFQRTNKRGEKISLRAFPLGGYCAFYGEDGPGGDADSDKHKADKDGQAAQVFSDYADSSKQADDVTPVAKEVGIDGCEAVLSFDKQKPWKRIIVLLAGATFNLISGVVFSFIFLLSVGITTPVVTQVYDTPNAVLLEKGDIIIAVNDKEFTHLDSFSDMIGAVGQGEGEVFSLTVLRGGVENTVNGLTKNNYVYTDKDGKDHNLFGIGIEMGGSSKYLRTGFLQSVAQSVPFTARMGGMVLKVLGGVFTGEHLADVRGPIGTINEIANISASNMSNVLLLLPVIAVNLGLFNLFPIPALDGSKIVFTTIEWIRGKPINQNIENIIHFVGFVLLFGLVFAVDIIHFFTRFT